MFSLGKGPVEKQWSGCSLDHTQTKTHAACSLDHTHKYAACVFVQNIF